METWLNHEMKKGNDMQDLARLQQSFDTFNRATAELKHAYARLEERFTLLDQELERKNKELLATIEEKERTRNYLQNILESMINGVIVTDIKGRILTLNTCAETLTGIREEEAAGRYAGILFDSMQGGSETAPDTQSNNRQRRIEGEEKK